MTSKKEAAKETSPTPGAGDSADAGEDGDFLALRESRENRVPECLDLSTITFLSEYLQHPVDQRNHVSRPTSSKLRKQTAASGDTLWAQLSEATESGPVLFLETLNKVTSEVEIHSPRLQNPVNKQNILHFVLELNDPELLDIVLQKASEELILHKFELEVMKISGKMTVFHQIVERNNIRVMKILLDKISRNKRVAILNEETPVEIKGQRPRTFPCLHLAAYYGWSSLVEYILDVSVDVNYLNAKKDTALLWAARWNHVETLRLLLSRGAKADLENDKGSTALYWAVRYDNCDSVVLLAGEGKADVNKQRKLGLVAPVVLASALGLTKTVKILLKWGADPNTNIRGNERPIHHAAKEGFSDIVELLIEYGAEVDAADVRGDTALLLAAKFGAAKALHTLLKHGASLEHRNVLGENVWKFAIASNNDLILKLLVVHQISTAADRQNENDPDVNLSADGINSLLFLAAAAGNVSMMSLLFQMKVNGNVTDELGNTFLHIAAINNQPQVIEEFHKLVNIDSINTDGNTALHEACTRGHDEVIVKLINIKAMANIRNAKGETSLHVAAKCRSIQPTTVSMLMDFVIKTHSWECLNMSDNCNNNALHIAARHARPSVLWEFRFVSLKAQDSDGNTALHNAVRPGEPEVLGIVLDIFEAMKRDCDINHQNKVGETPLSLAAREGFHQGVKRLMLFGADISLLNNEGNSVLHMLTSLTVTRPARCGHFLEVIQLILDRAPMWYSGRQSLRIKDKDQDFLFVRRRAILKLTTEIPNNIGLTVLDLACKVGACELIKLLVSMENVMAFKVGQITRYDVTSILPRTNGSLSISFPGTKVTPRTSCLTWLLVSGRTLPQNASKVLDIQPFCDIEAAYGAVANWSYAILITMHILYMSVFSWSGLDLLNVSRLKPGDRSISSSALVTYIIVPLEPLIIIFYSVYKLIKFCCCSGDITIKNKLPQTQHMLKTGLIFLITYVYSMFVIMWIIMYVTDFRFMDIFLSIALCLGWMLSIAFTRGFKVINYFWRLIQIMIVRDVFKFLVIYLFILLAFSFAFHVQFQVSQDVVTLYPNPAYTIFLMFNMLIGMEYVFEGDLVSNGFNAVNRSDVFMKVLYILYMILATIVMLNILIAMMNDSYQEILQRQQLTWRIESVALGVDVEQSIPTTFPLFSKVKVTHGHICPSDEQCGILRWFIEVGNIQGGPALDVSTNGTEDNNDAVSELQAKMAASELQAKMALVEARMSEQMNSIKNTVDDMNVVLRNLEQSLTSLK